MPSCSDDHPNKGLYRHCRQWCLFETLIRDCTSPLVMSLWIGFTLDVEPVSSRCRLYSGVAKGSITGAELVCPIMWSSPGSHHTYPGIAPLPAAFRHVGLRAIQELDWRFRPQGFGFIDRLKDFIHGLSGLLDDSRARLDGVFSEVAGHV